jgi:hypothetical protein
MRPLFSILKSHYPSAETVPRHALYSELGWEDLISKPEYVNTCAVRVSLALIRCGVSLRGRFAIKKGKYKGKLIEPGQAKLAKMLAEPGYLGSPEKFARADAVQSIGSRRGIIAFWSIPGYMNDRGGHIDLVVSAPQICGSGCFWNASTIWFWPLP